MKKTSSKLKAFSLIELSIVILVIGILIAGITQGSRLINQMRLSSARTLTNSSPVNSIADLVVWLESTSEESFDSTEIENSSSVSTWYDLNPHSAKKIISPKQLLTKNHYIDVHY